MYPEGHAGLSLAVLSLFMVVFGWVDVGSIITCLFIVGFSSLPDIDLRWSPRHHRGPTHSLLGGIIFGIVIAALLGYAGWSWQLGFISGFGGTVLHLLGDILTKVPIKPFWPSSRYKVALRLFDSKSPVANRAFQTLGTLAFLAVLLKHAGLL